ncbi:MAG: hydantoinase/oxoprolinase N-terminal domain-containing protein, partial [Chloroflexia bacterium]
MDGQIEACVTVGVDVGGTFTDFVRLEGDRIRIWKCSTTPADHTQAIVLGLAELGVRKGIVVHG